MTDDARIRLYQLACEGRRVHVTARGSKGTSESRQRGVLGGIVTTREQRSAALHPDFERRLVCTRCTSSVIVAELPERFLDALGYLCGQCLEQGTARREP